MGLTFFIVSGCNNAIDDILFKESLSASKGLEDRIDLDWMRDGYTDSEDQTTHADGYNIYRSTNADFNNAILLWENHSSTKYSDFVGFGSNDILMGRVYYYWVRSLGADFGNTTNYSWGYAMESESLKIYGGPDRFHHSINTSESPLNEVWFDFEAQAGWTYRFRTSEYTGPGGGPSADLGLEIYQEDIRDSDRRFSQNRNSHGEFQEWRCMESGKYYLKASESSGSTFLLTVWHE